MGLSLFKLEKLTITSFTSSSRSGLGTSSFNAMFNPASYSQTYAIKWQKVPGINEGDPTLSYSSNKPSELTLTLILDGTGVNQMALSTTPLIAVKDQITSFMSVAYTYNGSIHEPNYLLVEWGVLSFQCRLQSVTINYTLFNVDGTPLRAELSLTLLSDEDYSQRAKEMDKQSADLTHARIVRHGDTLPLLVNKIYGSSAYYLAVARYNRLDDFRNLKPGQQLLFPPLAAMGITAGSAGKG